jgi:hypothetical protein
MGSCGGGGRYCVGKRCDTTKGTMNRAPLQRMLIPDILNIQITSQMAIAATTMYRIHCPRVLGSVRLAILYLTLRNPRPDGAGLFGPDGLVP